jgi:hypothetical protein
MEDFICGPYGAVTVVEGRDRIGGRIRSETMGQALPPEEQRTVDLGGALLLDACACKHGMSRRWHVSLNTRV